MNFMQNQQFFERQKKLSPADRRIAVWDSFMKSDFGRQAQARIHHPVLDKRPLRDSKSNFGRDGRTSHDFADAFHGQTEFLCQFFQRGLLGVSLPDLLVAHLVLAAGSVQ
jgi:hypothetical protein